MIVTLSKKTEKNVLFLLIFNNEGIPQSGWLMYTCDQLKECVGGKILKGPRTMRALILSHMVNTFFSSRSAPVTHFFSAGQFLSNNLSIFHTREFSMMYVQFVMTYLSLTKFQISAG